MLSSQIPVHIASYLSILASQCDKQSDLVYTWRVSREQALALVVMTVCLLNHVFLLQHEGSQAVFHFKMPARYLFIYTYIYAYLDTQYLLLAALVVRL